MFIIEKEELIKTLTLMQRKSCGYDSMGFLTIVSKPPPTCDCKYGYNDGSFKPHYAGETTGCPELRNVIALLTLMTDEEYSLTLAKGHNFV